MRVIIIGAHPDDCEISAGGSACLFRERGDEVHMVSVTDGRSGHFSEEYIKNPQLLIDRRLAESQKAADVIGSTWANLGVPDGGVYVNPDTTNAIIREIRKFKPDLVLLNRPCDYHRDHRYVSQMVLDATYMLTVPTVCPDVPALHGMPVFAYWHDRFKEALPFRADVIVVIDSIMDKKTLLGAAHESQFYEWLPYSWGSIDDVPTDPAERVAWFRRTYLEPHNSRIREACMESLHAKLPHGHYCEAFQISEYGKQPSPAELEALFP